LNPLQVDLSSFDGQSFRPGEEGEASGAVTEIKTHTPYLNLHFSFPRKERLKKD
jgi:hypothetical protein